MDSRQGPGTWSFRVLENGFGVWLVLKAFEVSCFAAFLFPKTLAHPGQSGGALKRILQEGRFTHTFGISSPKVLWEGYKFIELGGPRKWSIQPQHVDARFIPMANMLVKLHSSPWSSSDFSLRKKANKKDLISVRNEIMTSPHKFVLNRSLLGPVVVSMTFHCYPYSKYAFGI